MVRTQFDTNCERYQTHFESTPAEVLKYRKTGETLFDAASVFAFPDHKSTVSMMSNDKVVDAMNSHINEPEKAHGEGYHQSRLLSWA